MKAAMIISYIFIGILAIVVFMQWRTIQKLVAPPAADSSTSTSTQRGSGTFGDFVKATQAALQPKEININL